MKWTFGHLDIAQCVNAPVIECLNVLCACCRL
uniref:Uncharacterized protein n=1 Tax=Arundo donax TaxID=35708 RepID=A0A0A9A0A4_ARUDO